MKIELRRRIPRWALPLHGPRRYKGASGGRSSGKSHFFAEQAVEEMVCDPTLRFVCIREVQRSLKFSAKSLVEKKIREWGLEGTVFDILRTEIRRIGGPGIMIFEGMQDHTADSLKSLEGFRRAWVEEAQSISKRSLDLLIPTIRADGSEIWFSWNPDQPEDPVDDFFANADGEDFVHVHSTYRDNPMCPGEMRKEAERLRAVDPEGYEHIWLGKYNVRSDVQVLAGKCTVDEYEPDDAWDGPYYGADWGFSQDPTMITRSWIGSFGPWPRCLMVDHEAGGVGISHDDIDAVFRSVPGAEDHVIRADSAEPGTIDHVARRGLKIIGAPKWSGSVEDGVRYLRSFDKIVIHERCSRTQDEARLWRYKVDRLTGDPLPKLEKGNDHTWDSVRYAHAPMIEADQRKRGRVSAPESGVFRRPGRTNGRPVPIPERSSEPDYTKRGAVSRPAAKR